MERELTFYELMMRFKDIFLLYLAPVAFAIILVVQLKMLSLLRSQLNLLMFYGKQIEEIRKMVGGQQARRLPEVPSDESGLYEVLRE